MEFSRDIVTPDGLGRSQNPKNYGISIALDEILVSVLSGAPGKGIFSLPPQVYKRKDCKELSPLPVYEGRGSRKRHGA